MPALGQTRSDRSCPLYGRFNPKSGRHSSGMACRCGRLLVGKSKLHAHCWSVQPCVRPVSAVRMTAGHIAIRESGAGQKPALVNVGCPSAWAAQIAIALLADTAEPVLAPLRVLLRHEPDPGREVPSGRPSDRGCLCISGIIPNCSWNQPNRGAQFRRMAPWRLCVRAHFPAERLPATPQPRSRLAKEV
jgi:hypothetical protein